MLKRKTELARHVDGCRCWINKKLIDGRGKGICTWKKVNLREVILIIRGPPLHAISRRTLWSEWVSRHRHHVSGIFFFSICQYKSVRPTEVMEREDGKLYMASIGLPMSDYLVNRKLNMYLYDIFKKKSILPIRTLNFHLHFNKKLYYPLSLNAYPMPFSKNHFGILCQNVDTEVLPLEDRN